MQFISNLFCSSDYLFYFYRVIKKQIKMDQGPIIKTNDVFFADIDVALTYSGAGFSVRGRDKKEVSKMFSAIEPDISERIGEPDRTKFLNILHHLKDPEFNTLNGNVVSISVIDEWYQGEYLSVYFGINKIFKVKLLWK